MPNVHRPRPATRAPAPRPYDHGTNRPKTAQGTKPDHDGGGDADLETAEIDAASETLRDGGVVRVALPGNRLALCTSVAAVKAAQRGQVPPNAVRLDRAASR